MAVQYNFGVNHVLDYYYADMVPFDTYFVGALAFVIEKATNHSVPIVTFAACEGSDNFVISSVETPTTSNYTYDSGTGPTTIEVNSSTIEISARRSQLAQAFTMCLLLINWTLALGSTYVTLIAVFSEEKVHEGVLLLPVTLVLTVPALRGLYVGSPPFGIYLGRSRVLRFWFRADVALRYIWVLLADDDSCVVLHDIVVRCYCTVHAGSMSLPQ